MVRGGSLFETADDGGDHQFPAPGDGARHADATTRCSSRRPSRISAGRSMPPATSSTRRCAARRWRRNWETLLALIAEVALRPTLPVGGDRARAPADPERDPDPRGHAVSARVRRDADGSLRTPSAMRGRVVGTRESIERLDRAALEAHYAAIYRPDRMVLAVSGQVPRDRVIRAAERLFRGMPTVAAASPRRPARCRRRAATAGGGAAGPAGAGARRLSSGPRSPIPTTRPCACSGIAPGRRACRDACSPSCATGGVWRTRSACWGRTGRARRSSSPTWAPRRPTPRPPRPGCWREIDRIRSEQVDERELARAKAFLLGNLAMDRRTNARARLVPGLLRGDRRRLGLPRALRPGAWRR